MNQLEVLTEVRDLLAEPGVWTKGAAARDREGKVVNAKHVTACSFCLMGAIEHVSGSSVMIGKVGEELDITLEKWDAFFEDSSVSDFIDFNDHADTTLEHTLELIDETIERLKNASN